MGRKLKILLAVVGLIVVIGIIAAALSPPTAQTPSGEEDGAEEPALIEKPASELVIALSDMEAGWVLSSEGEDALEAKGFQDGYRRVLGKVESEFTTRAIYTTAWTFATIEDADAHFESRKQEVSATHSTEARSIGDEAFYWEQTGDFIHMLIRKSNVVWEVSLFRDGTFTWDPTIDWVAETVLAKG